MASKGILCVIPARKGSKRLPDKNCSELNGKPLVAWTIEAALKIKEFSRVLVSTDSEKILSIAEGYGIKPPFVRPDELSRDDSPTFDVVKHAVEFLKNDLKEEYHTVVLLQPTSPLRKAGSIEAALKLYMEKNAKAVISVTPCEHSPLWTNTIGPDLSLSGFLRDEIKNRRSQDLPVYYRLNGSIYICNTSELLAQKTFFLSHDIYSYIMSNEESVDIDTITDFMKAESLMKHLGY